MREELKKILMKFNTFKTAFKFLEQNNLQAGYDELRTFKSLKKR